MELLFIGCAGFLLTHLGISGSPLRNVLRGAMGEQAYLGVYSLLSFATLGLMIYGYAGVPHHDYIWLPSTSAYLVTKVLLFIALVTLVSGTLTKNPTQVMGDAALDNEISGMLKITRHPIQWGILLFAIGHLIANGDTASVFFFGTFVLVSLAGMFSMDARKRQEEDPRWQQFMQQTSMVPFAAIVSGRLSFTAADINWMGLVAGIGLYAAVYWLHDMVAGGVSLF
jgi:uncharacterized membrane protein